MEEVIVDLALVSILLILGEFPLHSNGALRLVLLAYFPTIWFLSGIQCRTLQSRPPPLRDLDIAHASAKGRMLPI
jgi:hypothetical protein